MSNADIKAGDKATDKFEAGEQVWLLPGARSVSEGDGYTPTFAQVNTPTLVTIIGITPDGDYQVEAYDNVADYLTVYGYVMPEYLSRTKPTPAEEEEEEEDSVSHPAHYTRGNIEVIDYIEDKGLDFHLGNVVKYVSRAGYKTEDAVTDLRKAAWYLERAIELREARN